MALAYVTQIIYSPGEKKTIILDYSPEDHEDKLDFFILDFQLSSFLHGHCPETVVWENGTVIFRQPLSVIAKEISFGVLEIIATGADLIGNIH